MDLKLVQIQVFWIATREKIKPRFTCNQFDFQVSISLVRFIMIKQKVLTFFDTRQVLIRRWVLVNFLVLKLNFYCLFNLSFYFVLVVWVISIYQLPIDHVLIGLIRDISENLLLNFFIGYWKQASKTFIFFMIIRYRRACHV